MAASAREQAGLERQVGDGELGAEGVGLGEGPYFCPTQWKIHFKLRVNVMASNVFRHSFFQFVLCRGWEWKL